ncbi:MAG: HEAT repeat domain-containing protein [Verrucomicrobia bacterium]|nr:HEAT repeat domain-containing protein [Verrucomicrobiota bacterium]
MKRLVLLVLIVVSLGWAVRWALRPPPPQAPPPELMTLLEGYREPLDPEALARFREFGPAAVDFLASQLEQNNTVLQHWHFVAYPKLPAWAQARLGKPQDIPTARRRSLLVLSQLGPRFSSSERSLTALTRALAYPDAELQERSSQILADLGDFSAPAVTALNEVIRRSLVYPQGDSLSEALLALGQIGAPARRSLPALAGVLNQGSELERVYAARAILRIGGDPLPAVRILNESLVNSTNARVRAVAAGALSLGGDLAASALPFVSPAMDDPDAGVRLAAATTVLRFQPENPTAQATLAKLAKSSQPREALAAVVALANSEPNSAAAREQLKEWAQSHSDPEIRVRAACSLGIRDSEAELTVPVLLESLQQSRWPLNFVVLRTLSQAELRDTQTLAALRAGLTQAHPDLRWVAIESVRRIHLGVAE